MDLDLTAILDSHDAQLMDVSWRSWLKRTSSGVRKTQLKVARGKPPGERRHVINESRWGEKSPSFDQMIPAWGTERRKRGGKENKSTGIHTGLERFT